ncbi:MAG: hypothetical protein RL645_1005 [Actinomycetota bacterium]|jgi:hypothetical protein
MLQDALTRIAGIAEDVGVRAVQVHPINDEARAFYLRFGFEALGDPSYGLVLLIKDLKAKLNRD